MMRGILIGGAALSVAFVLAGCSAPTAPEPTPTPTPPPTAVSSNPDGCPDITASDFAIQVESTPADPVQLADSVGLAPLLEGTCAYGFTSPQFSGVAFFIVNASDSDAGSFFGQALNVGLSAGYTFGDSNNQGSLMTIAGQNADGAGLLVGYNSDVEVNDAEYTPERMAAIGLKPGDTLLFGSIQLP